MAMTYAQKMDKYFAIPRDRWKYYHVRYNGIFGTSTREVFAPNKTLARLFFVGEMNPGIKITEIVERSY
jgi:hypothetical protein